MNSGISTAFLDSNFLIAWTVKKDDYHASSQAAITSFKNNRTRLYTSNYVLQETITWLIYKASFTVVKHLKLEKIYTTDFQLRQTGLDVVVLSR